MGAAAADPARARANSEITCSGICRKQDQISQILELSGFVLDAAPGIFMLTLQCCLLWNLKQADQLGVSMGNADK